MNTTRTHNLTAALTALTVLAVAGCGSSSTTAAAGVNRSDPRAVSDAFATAWAAGDLAKACSFMGGAALRNLTASNQCTGTGGWAPQIPHEFKSCNDMTSGIDVFYNVRQQVDRFLIFGTQVTETAGAWAVTGFSENSPGEPLIGCATAPPSGTA
jgi:hypothetical protein